jgi:hypothetical protein
MSDEKKSVLAFGDHHAGPQKKNPSGKPLFQPVPEPPRRTMKRRIGVIALVTAGVLVVLAFLGVFDKFFTAMTSNDPDDMWVD